MRHGGRFARRLGGSRAWSAGLRFNRSVRLGMPVSRLTGRSGIFLTLRESGPAVRTYHDLFGDQLAAFCAGNKLHEVICVELVAESRKTATRNSLQISRIPADPECRPHSYPAARNGAFAEPECSPCSRAARRPRRLTAGISAS